MPRIKRWAPISHDFNRDPQIIQLRKDFGDWSALAWQELLFIADRNDGFVSGTMDQIARILAPVSLQMYQGRAANAARTILERFKDNSWITEERDGIQIVKYLKYHRPKEHTLVPSEPDRTKPDLIKNHKNDSPQRSEISVTELVESWNEVFSGKLPSVLMPLSRSRELKARARLKEHQSQDFWQTVFNRIGASRFLLGSANGTWKCSFDFLIANDTNCIKIFEGRYDNGEAKQQGTWR